jgi:hypothetical protein
MNSHALHCSKMLIMFPVALSAVLYCTNASADDSSIYIKKSDRTVIANFSVLSRRDRGQSLDSYNTGLTYVEKLSGDRTQYLTLSGNISNFNSARYATKTDTLSISYVHMWNGLKPGLSVFGGAYFSRNWTDYNLGTAPGGGNFAHVGGVGVLGGVVQYVPLSDKLGLTISATASLGRGLIAEMPREGNRVNVTLSPNAQLTYALQPNLLLSANVGAMISNNALSLSGQKQMGQAGFGVKYIRNEFTFDVNYSQEFIATHSGSSIGFSIARSF